MTKQDRSREICQKIKRSLCLGEFDDYGRTPGHIHAKHNGEVVVSQELAERLLEMVEALNSIRTKSNTPFREMGT